MKNLQAIVFAIVILFNGATLCAREISSHNSPVIHFVDSIIDFKTVKQGENLTRQIKVKNKGSRELKISNVRGSCGLMVIAFPRNDIAPGDSAIISFRYDSSRIGEFERILTVHSNSEENTHKIFIKGQVVPQ